MPATSWGWEITAEELAAWVVRLDAELLVLNKPGTVVVHPSKHGPWSSLVGACREWLGQERVHMAYRLDRETSGVMVFARNAETASRLQRSVQDRLVAKTYLAILCGELRAPAVVDRPIGRDLSSPIAARQWVFDGPEAQPACTEFLPVAWGNGYTAVRAHPRTGRQHQIRVHASWLGHPVVGDKLYGPDPELFLQFIAEGWTPQLAASLHLPRHALHAARMVFRPGPGEEAFAAPLSLDLIAFARGRMGLDDEALARWQNL